MTLKKSADVERAGLTLLKKQLKGRVVLGHLAGALSESRSVRLPGMRAISDAFFCIAQPRGIDHQYVWGRGAL